MTIQIFDTDALAHGSVAYNRETRAVEIATEITSYDQIEDLVAGIRRALRARGDQTYTERITKGMDPATYGLEIGDAVRVGKGKTTWTLVSILSDFGNSHKFVAQLVKHNYTVADTFMKVDVTRLVKIEPEKPKTETVYFTAEAAAAASIGHGDPVNILVGQFAGKVGAAVATPTAGDQRLVVAVGDTRVWLSPGGWSKHVE